MKIISDSATFAAQVASFSEGAGIFRWFNRCPSSSSGYFDAYFDMVKNASIVDSIDQMEDLGSVQIRVWQDGPVRLVRPPTIIPYSSYDQDRFIGQFSWFLVSIGMSLKNPYARSDSIPSKEKKKWGTAMKTFRAATPVPGSICIPEEEWEILRLMGMNPLLYRDDEFKEWALSRSEV